MGQYITYNKKAGRNIIHIDGKAEMYASYLAKQNPDICGEWFEGCEVHHINYNKTDDRPENLVCLTKEEHKKIHSKPIDVYYKNKFIGRYSSMTEAAKDNNISISAISYYCKHQKPQSSTYKNWRFARLSS